MSGQFLEDGAQSTARNRRIGYRSQLPAHGNQVLRHKQLDLVKVLRRSEAMNQDGSQTACWSQQSDVAGLDRKDSRGAYEYLLRMRLRDWMALTRRAAGL